MSEIMTNKEISPEIIYLKTIADERGKLTVQENSLPFVPVRTYWIYEADGQTRGGHRHHKTRQALVAITGNISIYLNDGNYSKIVVLDSPNKCLIVEPKDWHTMTFGANSILLVMSSHHYDRLDYIDEKYEVNND